MVKMNMKVCAYLVPFVQKSLIFLFSVKIVFILPHKDIGGMIVKFPVTLITYDFFVFFVCFLSYKLRNSKGYNVN